MKINTTSFGNYSKTYIDKTVTNPAAEKTDSPAITDAEKKFFAGMYPAQKNEINNYEFYSPKGKTTSVTLGSLIDRRG